MKIALNVEYNGAQYCGWQRQNNVISVQETVEKVLSQIAAEPIEVICAGRTDSGVHATGQVIHFETTAHRDVKAWTVGANALLPHDIAIRWATVVDETFHARFSATARRYQYLIYNAPLRSPFLFDGITHYYLPLDAQKMHQAGQYLLGEHDFSSFRASHCQAHSPCRNVHSLNISRLGSYIVVDIQANAFLHHMVRNIVGTLFEVGNGRQPIEWVAEVLAARDRKQAGATAKPNGLYLIEAIYPDHFALPHKESCSPLFLQQAIAHFS